MSMMAISYVKSKNLEKIIVLEYGQKQVSSSVRFLLIQTQQVQIIIFKYNLLVGSL